jgi:hypothetical protein
MVCFLEPRACGGLLPHYLVEPSAGRQEKKVFTYLPLWFKVNVEDWSLQNHQLSHLALLAFTTPLQLLQPLLIFTWLITSRPVSSG